MPNAVEGFLHLHIPFKPCPMSNSIKQHESVIDAKLTKEAHLIPAQALFKDADDVIVDQIYILLVTQQLVGPKRWEDNMWLYMSNKHCCMQQPPNFNISSTMPFSSLFLPFGTFRKTSTNSQMGHVEMTAGPKNTVPWAFCFVAQQQEDHATGRKRGHTYPELDRCRRCRFVVFGLEVGGRWVPEAASFFRLLACAAGTPAALRMAAQAAWVLRWSSIIAVAAQRALAATFRHGTLCCRTVAGFAASRRGRAPCSASGEQPEVDGNRLLATFSRAETLQNTHMECCWGRAAGAASLARRPGHHHLGRGLGVLGTPFGNNAYVQPRLRPKREEHDRLLQRIPAVDVLQATCLLLHYCACPPCQLLVALPPGATAEYASQNDDAVTRCLCALLGLADPLLLPEPTRAAHLALRFGGLGLRAASANRCPSPVADRLLASLESLPLLRNRCRGIARYLWWVISTQGCMADFIVLATPWHIFGGQPERG